MKKVVGVVVLIVVVAVVLGSVFLLRNLGPIAKHVVESVGSKVLGAPVTVADVSLSPFSGSGRIEGLVVGNPEGFRTPNAFSLGRVGIGVDLKSLRSDRTVINEILVEQPEITLEMTLRGKTNLGQLVENAQAAAAAKEEGKEPGEARPVVIRELLIREAKVRLSATALGGSTADLGLPEIRMRDIGEKGSGADAAQVIEIVLAAVVKAVLAQVGDADEIMAGVMDGVDDAARKAVTRARDELVGRIEGKLTLDLGGTLGGVADKAAGEASKALRGIGGLLGGGERE